MTQDEIRQMIAGNAFVNASDVEIIEEEDGEIITRVTLADKHKNPYGTAHGGLLYTMADAAAGFASCRVAGLPVTLHSDFHFIKNQKEGVITARARLLQKGGRIILLRVGVEAEDGELLAEGTFTYYDAGKKKRPEGAR